MDHDVHFPDLEEVKAHFRKNKKWYQGFGIGAFAGITLIIMRGSVKLPLDAGANGSETTALRSFFFSLYSRNSGNNIVTTVHTGGRGHPGFRIRHPETGLEFDTQGAVSRAFHIPENIVSKQLNGKIPNAHGEVFERIAA